MTINTNSDWLETTFLLNGRQVDAFHKSGHDLDTDCKWLREKIAAVLNEGGVLVRNEHDVSDMHQVELPGGITGYASSLPKSEIWYIPSCTFEQSLDLLDTFGFPKGAVHRHPEEVRGVSKSLLLDFAKNRKIAILNITSDSLYVERVGRGAEFTNDEMTRILDFKRQYFGVEHSNSFWRELRKHYRRKAFFVLGKG